jgi:hypothetical protein
LSGNDFSGYRSDPAKAVGARTLCRLAIGLAAVAGCNNDNGPANSTVHRREQPVRFGKPTQRMMTG